MTFTSASPAVTERAAGTGPAAESVAYPNIALVKYWGKRDEELFLPVTGSLSMTLDIFPTTTSVRVIEGPADVIEFNGVAATGAARTRIETFLDLVRARAGRADRAMVVTANAGPTGAGLASSASGFAALATAAAAAYELDLDGRALSRLARRGSGSAYELRSPASPSPSPACQTTNPPKMEREAEPEPRRASRDRARPSRSSS